MTGGAAKERDVAATEPQQVLSSLLPTVKIVAADRKARLGFRHGTPAYEVRALVHELLEPQAIFEEIAVAEQDDAVRLTAVLVVDVPIARLLLERHEQVVPALRAGARDRAQHREEERIDLRIVRRGIFEQQQRQRVRVLAAQVRGVLVDLVIELLRDRLDALARLLADHRAAAQRARNRRLRHSGQVSNVN